MEKLGHPSRRGDERRAVEARNVERRWLHEQARELAKQIAEVARQVAEEARRRIQNLVQRLEAAYRATKLRVEAASVRPGPSQQDTAETTKAITPAARDMLLGTIRATN